LPAQPGAHQLDDRGGSYDSPQIARLDGALDTAALRSALTALAERHETLRTSFRGGERVLQALIHPAAPVPLREFDLSGEADPQARGLELLHEQARERFDLDSGPLMRAVLVRLGAESHILMLTLHHVVTDLASQDVLVRELAELYAAVREGREPVLAELPVQYADYAAWQRESLPATPTPG